LYIDTETINVVDRHIRLKHKQAVSQGAGKGKDKTRK